MSELTLKVILFIMCIWAAYYIFSLIRAFSSLKKVNKMIEERSTHKTYQDKDTVTDLLLTLNMNATNPFYFIKSVMWNSLLKVFEPNYYNLVTNLSNNKKRILERNNFDMKLYNELIRVNRLISIIPSKLLLFISYESILITSYAAVYPNEIKRAVTAMTPNGENISIVEKEYQDVNAYYKRAIDDEMLSLYTKHYHQSKTHD
ncbi:MAG: hypothetical protein DRG78_01510 [Epsilonproteobacteria bacterium]|nr:MAG: hypothetical protein DRG78_01510 [Campylobacterota bacterium]